MKYCSEKKDVPAEEHWAVLKFVNVYVPGDERSQSCPGHGYPASNERHCDYLYFPTQEELESWIYLNSREDFVVLRVSPKTFRTKVNVNIE